MQTNNMDVLPQSYFQQTDVVQLARELIGKQLHTYIDGCQTSGYITETEAYRGYGDKACHAHMGKTGRNQIMYGPGGTAYVYLCYGVHHLFNIVTNTEGHADAVLIRAIEPVDGLDYMMERRKKHAFHPKLAAGPGNISQALGIHKQHYGQSIPSENIWVSMGRMHEASDIVASTRIGLGRDAEEDALLPWRFYPAGSPFISKK